VPASLRPPVRRNRLAGAGGRRLRRRQHRPAAVPGGHRRSSGRRAVRPAPLLVVDLPPRPSPSPSPSRRSPRRAVSCIPDRFGPAGPSLTGIDPPALLRDQLVRVTRAPAVWQTLGALRDVAAALRVPGPAPVDLAGYLRRLTDPAGAAPRICHFPPFSLLCLLRAPSIAQRGINLGNRCKLGFLCDLHCIKCGEKAKKVNQISKRLGKKLRER